MSGTTDKIKGAVDKALGKAKEKVGSAIGSDKLQEKGIAQNVKGHAESSIGKMKGGLKKGIDRI